MFCLAAVLERYADVAELSSDDLRQMKVIFKRLDDTRFKNVKDQPSLPSVVSFDYMKNYTPLGPIEPGMRLLKSVTVSTKVSYFLVHFLICLKMQLLYRRHHHHHHWTAEVSPDWVNASA